MGGEHQDRSGPWEESTKTGVVHGRRAPRQSYSRQMAKGSSSRLLLLVSQSHFGPSAQVRVQKRKRFVQRKDLVQTH